MDARKIHPDEKKRNKSYDILGQSAYPLHQSGSRSSHDNGSL